jgi:thiaminase
LSEQIVDAKLLEIIAQLANHVMLLAERVEDVRTSCENYDPEWCDDHWSNEFLEQCDQTIAEIDKLKVGNKT